MLKVSLRGIRSHLFRFISTLLAVMLGVGFMCGTVVLGDTVKKGFDDAFADIYANIDVVVRSTEKVSSQFGGEQRARVDASTIDTLKGLPGVEAVDGQIQRQTTIIGPDGEPIGPTGGAPTFLLNWPTEPSLNAWVLTAGGAPSAPDDAVVSAGVAKTKKIQVGDTLRVQAPSGLVDVKVSGIAKFGKLDTYGGTPAVLVPTEKAQQLGAEPGKFDWINVAAEKGQSQEQVRDEVQKVLPAKTEALTGEAFTEEQQSTFRELISILTNFITAFGVIALFVGAFIIYNTFTIIVTQRTQELALLRALGAARRQVVGSVFLEALVVGVIASLIGVGFGLVLATVLQKLLDAIGLGFPGQSLVIQPGRFVGPVLLAVIVTLLSAIFPAVRASRVPPIAAMRSVAIDTANTSRVRMVLGAVFTVAAAGLVYAGFSGVGDNALVLVGAGMLGVFLGAAALGPIYSKPLARVLGAPLARVYGITGRLARENSLRNPSRTATTAAALIVSVGLVSLITIAGESIKETRNKVIDETFRGDFIVSDESGFLGFPRAVSDQMRGVDGVDAVAAIQVGQAEIGDQSPDGDQSGRFLFGADLPSLDAVFKLDVKQGSTDLSGEQVAVNEAWAERRGKKLGDSVPMRFKDTGIKVFRIGAIYGTPAFGGGAGYLIPTETFDANFPAPDRTDLQAFVKLAPGADIAQVRPQLEAIVEPYKTVKLQDLTEFKRSQAEQIDQSLFFVYAMLGLAVVIGLIGIVNTLLLSVYERTHELGLMRAVGMARMQVRRTIRLESVIIALIGTIAGLVIGLFFAWALVRALSQNQREQLIFAIPYGTLLFVMGAAAVFGILAALWPAWRAARLNVLDAIATE